MHCDKTTRFSKHSNWRLLPIHTNPFRVGFPRQDRIANAVGLLQLVQISDVFLDGLRGRFLGPMGWIWLKQSPIDYGLQRVVNKRPTKNHGPCGSCLKILKGRFNRILTIMWNIIPWFKVGIGSWRPDGADDIWRPNHSGHLTPWATHSHWAQAGPTSREPETGLHGL